MSEWETPSVSKLFLAVPAAVRKNTTAKHIQNLTWKNKLND